MVATFSDNFIGALVKKRNTWSDPTYLPLYYKKFNDFIFDTSDSAYDLTYAIYILIYVIGIFFLIRHIKRWVRSYLIFTFALASITLMLIYIIMSLITSNDPLYSITKLINYFIPLIIIVTLVYLIKEVDELIKWLANQVVTFILFTLILLVMSLIKVLSQEQSFKGFFNDSNTFAVFSYIRFINSHYFIYEIS